MAVLPTQAKATPELDVPAVSVLHISLPGSSSVTLSGYINPEFEKFYGRKPTDEEVALAVAGLLHFGASGYVGNDGKFNIKKYTD